MVSDKITAAMLILLPILIFTLAASILLMVEFFRLKFRYSWLVAVTGAMLALVAVFLWQIRFPDTFFLLAWQPVSVFNYRPHWRIDSVSWPYAMGIAALALAVVLTSPARNENRPFIWAGTLLLAAFGISAAAAADPLTLVLVWAVFDLTEMATMIGSVNEENSIRNIILAYTMRLLGMGFLILAIEAQQSAHLPLEFADFSQVSGLLLLMGTGLRLGILPLRLPYQSESILRRGFGTTLRLISAAISLSVLGKIPVAAISSPLRPYLLIVTALPALYAGWMWVRSSDELIGRPFWVLGLAALSIATTLLGNPLSSAGWGMALLAGGLLFLYSARQRRLIWLILPGLWALSGLPFSVTAIVWSSNTTAWFFTLPFLFAQALFLAGFLRHALHPGESSFESQEKWGRIIYPLGLFLLATVVVLCGLWGWEGAARVGQWGQSLLASVIGAAFFLLAVRFLHRSARPLSQWGDAIRLNWLYRSINAFSRALENIALFLTHLLEGEGGILWSFLLLVLLVTLVASGGR